MKRSTKKYLIETNKNKKIIKENISTNNRKQIIERIQIIKEDVIDKQIEIRSSKLHKIADSIKRNANSRSKIWEVKKKRVTKRKYS